MRLWSLSLLLMGLLCSHLVFGQTRKLDLSAFSPSTREKLLQRIPSLKNGTWTYSELDQLLQFLIKDEQYDSARIVRMSENEYRAVVGKIRRVHTLQFTGSSVLNDSALRRETGLAEKAPFDPSLLIEAGEKIRTIYEGLGYPKTQVDVKYLDSSITDVNVTVEIREGPRTEIKRIWIVANNPELKGKMERLARRFEGDPLNSATLADLRGRLRKELSSNKYWRTEIPEPEIKRNFEESEAELTFHVKNSDQYFFDIEGDVKIRKPELEGALQLESYFSSSPNVAGELATKARSYYLAKGFARVEIDAEEIEGNKPYTRRVILKINEGPRVRIEKIELSGSFSQPQKFYVNFLKEHSSSEVESGRYVKDDLDVGIKNLITDRWNQGFLRARVVSTRTIYNKDRSEVTVLINLEEGPLTQVQKISFEDVKAFPENELIKVLDLEAGKPLRLSALDEAILKIKDYYRRLGYLEMNLVNEKEGLVTYNDDNTLVHLNFKIFEGPQVRVASILIEGNTLTRDEVIYKELEFSRGDVLTPQLIDESISRLQRLGFFNSVEIKTLEEKTMVSERTVLVRVSDRDPGVFNFGAGVNSERGITVRGYTGIAYRNINGTGRGGSLRLEGNYNVNEIKYLENKITLGYVEPYLFNSRIRGRVNLTRQTAISDFDKRQASEVNQTTWSLEQDVTSHLLVVWDVFNIATIRDFFIDRDESNTLNIGSTAITADLDYRNHPFNPSEGHFSRVNLEFGAPYLGSSEQIQYGRAYGLLTHYLPIFSIPNFVWANSVRGGYIKNLSDKANGAVPYDKKGFILGGQSTIRGFTPDEAFPTKIDFGTDRYSLRKSATMSMVKSEVRFPFWGAVGGAVFYDGGQVKVDCEPTDTACLNVKVGWRDSAGLAVRYVTPVGAVSLEYAWKLKANGDRNEDPAVFHFSIGTF
ncbi:MAG: POTRA domain-containing protein [Bdellovibrio sp.]